MPTFHFYLDGKKYNELHGAAEVHLKDMTHKVAVEAEKANAALALHALEDYYSEADATKPSGDVHKIYHRCVSLANAGGTCAGNAARELSKKLESKFGFAPELTKRGAKYHRSKKHVPVKTSTLDKTSTDDLVAELERRGRKGDDLAVILAEAAAEYLEEDEELDEEDDEEDEDALPLYHPPKRASFSERVVIIGGGPAGLAAAVYAARSGLAPIVVAPVEGGQLLGKGVTIENYPGLEGETGPSLVARMQRHAAEYGTVFYQHKVTRAWVEQGSPFTLECDSGRNLSAHALIVSTGADSKWLGLPGEHDYRGGGVSSCATCDGFVYRDQPVAVIGGGDAAMEDALVLARTSSHVTVIHRRDAFRASKVLADRVLHHPRIDVRWNTTTLEFKGAPVDHDEDEDTPPIPMLSSLDLRDVHTGARTELQVSGAFIAIGHDPNTGLFAGQLQSEDTGYLKLAGSKHFTTQLSVPGVFAAGDVADDMYRQAITSAGSGAAAALDAERWLSERGISDDFELEVLTELSALYNDTEAGLDGASGKGVPASEILSDAKSDL